MDNLNTITATYDITDDKLRIYTVMRLATEDIKPILDAGFRWAPKQECWYATWTPTREDVCLSICDEIEDETFTHVERAADRKARFEVYADNRAKDSQVASSRASSLLSCITPGQPILVGHHSEKRHRGDLRKIDSAMSSAVKNDRLSEYWQERASAVAGHAQYREMPAVRARRIKTLTAELRGIQARQSSDWNSRWASHLQERIAFESAMLQSDPDATFTTHDYQPGGKVQYRNYDEWHPILKVNKRDGQTVSLTVSGHFRSVIALDRVTAYQPPEEGTTSPKLSQPPLLNYNSGTAHVMTSEEYAAIHRDYKATQLVKLPSPHRVRTAIIAGRLTQVFLSDKKDIGIQP